MENFELRIKKLVLNNFRQFETMEIDFDEKLTVIIAENGGGKTTILDSLSGMMSYIIEQIKYIPKQKEPFVKTDIRWEQAYFENVLAFYDTLMPLSVRFDRDKRDNPSAFNLENESVVFQEFNQQVRMGVTNLPIIAYYPCYLANYPLSNGQGDSKDTRYVEPFDAYDHALDDYVLDFKALKTWLIGKFHIERENGDTVFNLVREALVGEKGMLNDDAQRRFTDLKVTYQENPNGNFVFLKDKIMLFETQLSSGERSLMTLVADIARRLVIANPLSKNPLLEGCGLVLIDEIDLHLHPLWQRKVVGKLLELFPKVQFVVTTHSPTVIASLKPEHIRLIIKDNTTQQRIVVNAQEAHLHTKGLEPNRILKEIMDTPLRDVETQEKMKTLNQLLKTDDSNPTIPILLAELTEDLGKEDTFIMRIQQEILMLKRKKQATHEVH